MSTRDITVPLFYGAVAAVAAFFFVIMLGLPIARWLAGF